jgi:hypothetical protein
VKLASAETAYHIVQVRLRDLVKSGHWATGACCISSSSFLRNVAASLQYRIILGQPTCITRLTSMIEAGHSLTMYKTIVSASTGCVIVTNVKSLKGLEILD